MTAFKNTLAPGVRDWLTKHYGFDRRVVDAIMLELDQFEVERRAEYLAIAHGLAEKLAYNADHTRDDHWFDGTQGLDFLDYVHEQCDARDIPLRQRAILVNKTLGVATPYNFRDDVFKANGLLYMALEARSKEELDESLRALAETQAEQPNGDGAATERANKEFENNRRMGETKVATQTKESDYKNGWSADPRVVMQMEQAAVPIWTDLGYAGGEKRMKAMLLVVAGGEYKKYDGTWQEFIEDVRKYADQLKAEGKNKKAAEEAGGQKQPQKATGGAPKLPDDYGKPMTEEQIREKYTVFLKYTDRDTGATTYSPYLKPAGCVLLLRREHPNWGIAGYVEQIFEPSGDVLARAQITDENGIMIAQNYSLVRNDNKAKTFQGRVAEAAVTRAVGRACGLAGYGIDAAGDMDEESD